MMLSVERQLAEAITLLIMPHVSITMSWMFVDAFQKRMPAYMPLFFTNSRTQLSQIQRRNSLLESSESWGST